MHIPSFGHVRRGFTLIELLVVIAIIGILSSVVLASLNTARGKGNDAAVKSNLATIAVQSELYYDSNSNSYGGAGAASCTVGLGTDSTVTQALAAADNANGTGSNTCYIGASAYAVQSSRPASQASTYWCIDNTGKKCGINTAITGTTCGACATQN